MSRRGKITVGGKKWGYRIGSRYVFTHAGQCTIYIPRRALPKLVDGDATIALRFAKALTARIATHSSGKTTDDAEQD